MTPLHMVILLHCHTSPSPYAENDPAHASSDVVRDFKTELLNEDLIVMDSDGIWRSTSRGKALIEEWLTTPLPEMRWIVPPREDRRA